MTDLARLVVHLVGDITDYQASLKTAENDAGGFAARIAGGLSTIGGGVVTAIGIATGAALTGIGFLAKGAIAEAINAEEVQTQVNAALANTGAITGVTSKMIDDLANHWQSLTRFEDENVKAGGAVIAGFKQINSDVFPDALRLSLDLATKWKTDVPSAATIFAKALADPGVGLLKLKTAGVVFTDQEEAMITAMQKAGNTAGAQAIMIDVVNKAVGGSAEAAGKTAAGTWDRLRNIWANVLEVLGTGLLPTITNVGQALAEYLAKPETQAFIGMLAEKIAEFAQSVVAWFPQVVQWFQQGFGWLSQNQGMIVAALAAIGTAVIAFAISAAAALWAAVLPLLPAIAVMLLVAGVAYLIYQAWTTNWGGIQEKTAAVIAWLTAAFQNVVAVIAAIWNNPIIQLTVQTVLTNIKLIVGAFQAAFAGDWTRFGEMLRMAWDNAWRMIGILLKTAIDNFRKIDWGAVGTSILQGIANGILAGIKIITNAAVSAAKAALAAAKGFLGIHSPSSVFEMEVGYQMAAGAARGWQGGLNKMMPGMVNGLMPAGISPGGGGAVGGITLQIINPTFFGTDQYEVARVMEPAVDLLLRRKGLK